MKNIINTSYSQERSLYAIKDSYLENVSFVKGEEDGESPLKECDNIKLEKCYFDLRYPLWHDNGVEIANTEFTVNSRAALWYSNNITINKSKLHGIKALRECSDIKITNSDIISPEFMWRDTNIKIDNCSVEGEYAFFECRALEINHLTFKGKYSFQYVVDMNLSNSELDTKDAFWHTKNVTVRNCVLKGEYLAWYSENLTLIDCEIISHQPLCYCKNLKLINCKMKECDLAFEYSEVAASIIGSIKSIKNPKSGTITVDKVEEIITEQDKYQGKGKIIIR